jgi:hypothetical protein
MTTTTAGAVSIPRLRAELAVHLERQPSTVALTLVYNDPSIPLDRIRRDLRAVHARLDRRLYGCRFHLRPAAQRTRYWATVELLDDYPHVHVGWLLPDGGAVLRDMLDAGLWTMCAPAGTYDVQRYRHGWATYAVKCLTTTDHVIDSHEDIAP